MDTSLSFSSWRLPRERLQLTIHFMDAIQTITPLIGVAMGSLLTGAGVLYKARKERRQLIAATLADLLEVRHRLTSADLAIRSIRDRVELQPALLPGLRVFLEQILPKDASLDERYDKAVTMLASIDPILAFTLRSKNWIPRVFSDLRAQGLSGGLDRATIEQMEAELRAATTPALNSAVVELAAAHSWLMKVKVRRLVKRSSSAPEPFLQLLERMQATSMPGNDARQL